MKVFDWAVQLMGIVLALAAAPVFLGWVNQCRAWLQNQSAPSILQPYRGIRKLFHKEAVIAQNASQLFRLAPYVVFGAMVTAAAVIPSVATRLPITRAADAIALVGLLATARVFLSLGGDGHRDCLRYARCAPRNDDRIPRGARTAGGDLRRFPDQRHHGIADYCRTPLGADLRTQSESRLYRGGIHDGAAGRKCPYPG